MVALEAPPPLQSPLFAVTPSPGNYFCSTTGDPPPPPLAQAHAASQENNGQTGALCLDKLTLTRDERYKKNAWRKTCRYLTLNTIAATGHHNTVCRQTSACFGSPHLPIRGIQSGGIEPLANPAPHLKELHTLALWALEQACPQVLEWAWASYPFVINNVFGEVKLALKHMAKPESPTDIPHISDHKNRGQKKPGKEGQTGSPCLVKPVLAQGVGGGGIQMHVHDRHREAKNSGAERKSKKTPLQ